MCPRVTTDYKKEKKSHIIRSAIKCFSKYGFDKTRMDDVVNESELSKGTLYNYFSSKEDLFQAIAEDSLNLLKLQLSNIFIENRADILTNIERFYDEFRKTQREGSEKVFFEVIAESSRNPKLQKIMRDHQRKIFKICFDQMQLQIQKGWFKENVNIELIAAGIVSLIDGLTIGRILGIPENYNKKIWMEINRLIFDGLDSK